MLGLGNSMTGGAALEDVFTPESISNIALWLKSATNVESDSNSNGTVSYDPVRTVAAGNISDNDRVSAWRAAGSTSIDAVQTLSGGDKPRWNDAETEVKFSNNAKHMKLDSEITIAANTDFTVVIRFKTLNMSGARALMGDSTNEFLQVQDSDTIRLKTNGTQTNFDGGTMATDKYQTLILVRSDGSTGNINLFMRGTDSGYFDGTATGTSFGDEAQDTEEIIFEFIGSQQGSNAEFNGFITDVIIYNGTAVTSAQREQLYDYIEAAI